MTKSKPRYTKAEREARWETCIKYLKRCGNLPAAQKVASQEGVSFNTSVWVTALGKMLGRGERPS